MHGRLDALLARFDRWCADMSRGWSASAETLMHHRLCCCL